MKSGFLYSIIFMLLGMNVFAQQFKSADAKDIALFPQQNDSRNTLNLSGIWNFKKDSLGVGEKEQWFNGLKECRSIAVPGSWNEQFDDMRDYLDLAWYEKETYIPAGWKGQRIFVRVGSANYAAKIWINGIPLGQHEGGNLPFALEITSLVKWNTNNRISIEIENILKPERVPTGGGTAQSLMTSYPKANFDFFPYAGLQRAVWLYSVPSGASIKDITLKTTFESTTGTVEVKVELAGKAPTGKVVISGNNQKFEASVQFSNGEGTASVQIPNVRLWSPEDPFLYTVSVILGSDNKILDHYITETGVRTITANNKQLLLNGKPIFLKGFGKHEDFPVFGRGTAYPVMVKDYSLLKWVGANSYRTSHYPYDEEYMNMADREGILIIDEIPAVGLYFHGDTSELKQRQVICRQDINELILRDKNHPSVIIWSIANEPTPPNISLSPTDIKQGDNKSIEMLTELFQQVKKQDPTRLSTLVGVMGGPIEWLGLSDIVCINRYWGWYTNPGDIKTGAALLSRELDMIYQKLHKPIIITEFGADTYPGMHAEQPEMFTEEYQTEFIKAYLDVADTKDFVTGMQVWAFADFKTGQGIVRFGGMNYKGVFTRDRKPKMAAHYLRSRWLNK
jgi:beta-glucuronidase